MLSARHSLNAVLNSLTFTVTDTHTSPHDIEVDPCLERPSPSLWFPSHLKTLRFRRDTASYSVTTTKCNCRLRERRPTLSLPYDEFAGLATKCWLQQTWQLMDRHEIRIEDTSPDFLLSRANDQLLVPLFHDTGIRGHELYRVNLCRLYLQVLMISDITTGCGNKITKLAWNGQRDTTRTS
jgi:hypothetical protein